MHILRATIIKDMKILLRDRVGLFMMFFMPILLVIVITSVQNSTFELVNNNKISLIIYNNDKDSLSVKLIEGIGKIGLFKLQISDSPISENKISSHLLRKDALVALVIPEGFTKLIGNKAEEIAARSLKDPDSLNEKSTVPIGNNRFPENVLSSSDAGFIPPQSLRCIEQCCSGYTGRSDRKKIIRGSQPERNSAGS